MAIAQAYTSPLPVYVDGIFYGPGERFTTDAPKGRDWVLANGGDADDQPGADEPPPPIPTAAADGRPPAGQDRARNRIPRPRP